MFQLKKNVVSEVGFEPTQVAVRHGSSGASPSFHSKYGTPLLIGGAAFCTTVWVLTSTGITWNLSPVGKVQPKPWKE
uniref:Cytochrome c oxidase subunit 7B, mitochondrial n=1 Tax=Denticeps clupeoides TaxID=299321 RepID=A0AAY4EB14_9TELE